MKDILITNISKEKEKEFIDANSAEQRLSIRQFFMGYDCYSFEDSVEIKKSYPDFEFFFALKLRQYETDVIFNTDEGLKLIGEINHPALGLLLDTYHVNIEESSWTDPFRRAMASGRLWHVHLGDNNRLPPGQGLIDFPAIITTLREISYTSYLSAELIPRPDPDTAATQTLKFMKMILEE